MLAPTDAKVQHTGWACDSRVKMSVPGYLEKSSKIPGLG